MNSSSCRAYAVKSDDSSLFLINSVYVACHSRYSHVDIVIPGQGLLGVSGPDKHYNDPGGVRIRPFEPWPYSVFTEVEIQTGKTDAIIARGLTQLGKPFDNEALYAFFNPYGTPRDWRELASWFCSEWFIWAEEAEGLFPYELCVPMDMINPNDTILLNNPFMSMADIRKLRG